MKVWITRPDCVEFYSGGWRSVHVWVEKPHFDQRPLKVAFGLFHPETDIAGPEVYQEGGWVSGSRPGRAKPFLEQDPELMKKVRLRIYESLVPADSDDPLTKSMNEQEYDRLTNLAYEMECVTHWKRFLLEVDLRAHTAELIEPEIAMLDGKPRGHYPVTEQTGLSSLFLKGDLTKPYFYEDYLGWDRRFDVGL
jgi:hypothetical protein